MLLFTPSCTVRQEALQQGAEDDSFDNFNYFDKMMIFVLMVISIYDVLMIKMDMPKLLLS